MDKGVTKIYRISRKLYLNNIKFMAQIIKIGIRIICAATIPYTAEIGYGTKFPHGAQGVIIHDKSIIGYNCLILPNVIIGGKKSAAHPPIIGNNVTIGANATIIGEVNIGNNVVIGAGSVVLSNIPDNTLVAGNPATIKKYFK